MTKEPEVIDVVKILAPYDYRWRDIGKALYVREGFLEELWESHGMSDLERLDKILQSWIDTRCSEVSWNHFKKVLEDPPVRKKGIAKELSESIALFKLINKLDLKGIYIYKTDYFISLTLRSYTIQFKYYYIIVGTIKNMIEIYTTKARVQFFLLQLC